jgi:hypothetical protein
LFVLQGEVLGVLTFRVFTNQLAEFPLAATAQGHQGRGYGRILVELVLDYLQEVTCKPLIGAISLNSLYSTLPHVGPYLQHVGALKLLVFTAYMQKFRWNSWSEMMPVLHGIHIFIFSFRFWFFW